MNDGCRLKRDDQDAEAGERDGEGPDHHGNELHDQYVQNKELRLMSGTNLIGPAGTLATQAEHFAQRMMVLYAALCGNFT